MSRKRCHRRVIVPMPPRGLRPKLKDDQVRDLALAHLANLDSIARGQADVDVLWQWAGGIYTWSRAAELLKLGQAEMDAQLELAAVVIERFQRTGRVLFTGTEYQLAKSGVDVMDALASQVDRATAIAAAEWSEAQLNARAAASQGERVA